jgi:hypothetical protein
MVAIAAKQTRLSVRLRIIPIDRKDVAVQSDVFDAELLWRAGALDIDLVVSHYAS